MSLRAGLFLLLALNELSRGCLKQSSGQCQEEKITERIIWSYKLSHLVTMRPDVDRSRPTQRKVSPGFEDGLKARSALRDRFAHAVSRLWADCPQLLFSAVLPLRLAAGANAPGLRRARNRQTPVRLRRPCFIQRCSGRISLVSGWSAVLSET
jgi:hypothetical protein